MFNPGLPVGEIWPQTLPHPTEVAHASSHRVRWLLIEIVFPINSISPDDVHEINLVNVFWYEARKLRLFLQHQCDRECQFILNVSTFMTWSDEDFIGRICRLARRCAKPLMALRTTQRAKALYVRQWTRHDMFMNSGRG